MTIMAKSDERDGDSIVFKRKFVTNGF
jgi:hypothetical protein